MKKLMILSLAAALVAPSFAEDPLDPVSVTDEPKDGLVDVQTDAAKAAAWWPACFGICEWPETPDLVGIRLTIPFSTKQESVTGIDIGLWGRCTDFEGLAVSVLRNDVKDTFAGIQIGLYNSVVRADLFSIQAGLWNEAHSFRGVQAGLVNLTGDGEGFQVGLINRAETLYGFQVGLINVIRDAEVPMLPGINIGF